MNERVAGKTWGVPVIKTPLTDGRFEMVLVLPSSKEALQLQRMLGSLRWKCREA